MKDEVCEFCHGSLMRSDLAMKVGLLQKVNGRRTCSLECHRFCKDIQVLLGKRPVHIFCDIYGSERVTYG